jgi:hypothetical protein
MNNHERVKKAFAGEGLEYTGQVPHDYSYTGRRSVGLCPICSHHGTDCRCSAAKFWLWWIENRKEQRVKACAKDLFAALRELRDRWPFLGDPSNEEDVNGGDFVESVAEWFRDHAAPAIAKAEGRAP